MSRFILFAYALLMLNGAHAAQKTILVVGDSLSAGYGLRQDEAWPTLLEQRLRQHQLDFRVANASISGDTTAGGRSRLAAALKQYRPQLVVIALGGNDGLRGLPPSAVRENIEAMIDASVASGAKTLVVGIDMPPNYGAAYREKFRAAFRDAARSRRVPLVPFMLEHFGERRDYFQPDGVHPTAAAQPLILDTIWRELQPMLGTRRTAAL